MGSLLKIYAIGMLYAKWMLKNKLFYVYLTLFMPFSILVPFYLITSEGNRPYIAIGTIVLTLLSNSLVTACQDLATDKLLKRIAVLLSKPISSMDYFLGQLFSNALQTFPAVTIMVVILCLAGILQIHNISLFIVGLMLGWYLSTAIGYALAIALSSRDYNTIVIVSNVVSFVLVFLAPIYYPPTYLPELARLVTLILPSIHVANIIGMAGNINYGLDLINSITYLLILISILTVIIIKKTKIKDLY